MARLRFVHATAHTNVSTRNGQHRARRSTALQIPCRISWCKRSHCPCPCCLTSDHRAPQHPPLLCCCAGRLRHGQGCSGRPLHARLYDSHKQLLWATFMLQTQEAQRQGGASEAHLEEGMCTKEMLQALRKQHEVPAI